MKSVESSSGDWTAGLVEPDSFEPPYPDPQTWPADEDKNHDVYWEYFQQELVEAAREEHARLNEIRGKEMLDAASEIDLFEGIVLSEEDECVNFVVPPRYLYSARHGVWKLDVKGQVYWFKKVNDYGRLLFESSGVGGWVPHVYAFEDVNENGLPVFTDKERAEVQIELTRMHYGSSGSEEEPREIRLKTAYGSFVGIEDTVEMWGGQDNHGMVVFDRYRPRNREHPAFHVRDDGSEDYELGERNDWKNVEGGLWVPIDLLRAGLIDARVTFPLFADDIKPTEE